MPFGTEWWAEQRDAIKKLTNKSTSNLWGDSSATMQFPGSSSSELISNTKSNKKEEKPKEKSPNKEKDEKNFDLKENIE